MPAHDHLDTLAERALLFLQGSKGGAMQLKLKRSQKTSGMLSKTAVFCLDARLDLAPAERANVEKYKLGPLVIYNSESSKKHLEHIQAAAAGTGGLLKGAISIAMAKLALNITIDGLTRGQHVECKDLQELMGAEEAINAACENTKAYLDLAATFDGREIVIDFNDPQRAAA